MSDATRNPMSQHDAAPARRSKSNGRVGLPADSKPVLRAKAGVQSQLEPNHPNVGRVEQLPRDVGWLLFGVGFAGFVAPGVFGLPFMVAGGMILWPKTTSRLWSLLGRRSSETMTVGIKQVIRFLDDLEKRYPSTGKR